MTVGSDVICVELGQPSDPILIDGESSGLQCADGSCRTDDCLRLAIGRAYAAPVYDTVKDAEQDGHTPGADNIIVWDEVDVEAVDEDEDEVS